MFLPFSRSPVTNPVAASAQWEVIAVARECLRNQTPMAESIAALAGDHNGWISQEIRSIGQRLFQGASLGEAFDAAPDLIQRTTRLSVRVGESTGTLRETLDHFDESLQSNHLVLPAPRRHGLFELLFVIPAVGLAMTFTAIFITPTLEAMFSEFGIELPAVSRAWFAWAEWIGVGIMVLFVASILLPIIYFAASQSRSVRDSSGWGWLASVRRIRRAEVLEALSIPLRQGRPLAAAIPILARYHGVRQIERRLALTQNDIEHGSPLSSALMRNGFLGSQECHAFEMAPDASAAGWTLSQFAAKELSQGQTGVGVLRSLLRPLVIFFLAGLVAWFALAFFMPLVALIQGLTGYAAIEIAEETFG